MSRLDPIARVAGNLASFKGNARTCILVEPLWGIPYYLFVPYASLYMLALGVSETQIGILSSIAMVLQMVWSFTAGWITDRLGRKRTSLLFDVFSWSMATLVWAFARDFTWFLAAAVLNSMVRVVHISWSCLFIEDSEPSTRVHLYTWIAVAGTLAGFFAPIAGLFVRRFGLVPATRGLYLFAFIVMTLMFLIRNSFTTETAIGKMKMKEARENKGGNGAWREYASAAKALFTSREATLAFLLSVLSNIHLQTRNSFLSVVMTKGIGLSPAMIALFPPLASAVTLGVYLFIIPRIRRLRFALTASLTVNVAGNLLLFFAPSISADPAAAVGFVLAGTFAVALGIGVTTPVIDAVLANAVDDKLRASILSIVYTLMYLASAPFGYLAGLAAGFSPRLPAALAAAIMAIAAALACTLRPVETKAAAR